MSKRSIAVAVPRFTIALAGIAGAAACAQAGVVFGFNDGTSLAGGFRWDAAPRTISGLERSLAGGLRYSVQGGSYQAYRDSFTWNVVPSVASFQTAVEQAFNAWTVTDPVSGLPGMFSFVSDFATPVDPTVAGNLRLGAEIDLFATNLNDNGTRGFAFFNAVTGPVTLTSGTAGYNAGAISGADVTINSNPGAIYTLDLFRRLLTHELGHAIGLGDLETNPGAFIDDNLDLTNSATAAATLNNSWALLVNTANPAASPLARYTVPFGDPGSTTPGVNILMESNGLGIGPTNPVTNLFPLTNDDYGTRQFLYPTPAPGAFALLGLWCYGTVGARRRR